MEFFKKIFRKEPEEITLKTIDLQDFVEEISIKILSEENEIIKNDLAEFSNNLNSLKEKLNEFEKSDISLNDREKLFFEGNKKAYLSKLYKFIEQFYQEIKNIENLDFAKLENFCANFQKSLEALNKDVAKNYSIISHYIDLRDSNAYIKKLDSLINEILEFLNDGKIAEYKKITSLIKQANEKKILSEKIKNEIQELEHELIQNKEKKKLCEKKLLELKESQEFLTYTRLLNEKESLLIEIKNLSSDLNNNLKPLDKELKKYAHESLKNEIIFEYLNDPLEALEKDTELKIFHILEQIKLNLEMQLEKEGSDDKRSKKAIKQLTILTKDFFENIKKKYFGLKKDKDIVEGVLSRSPIIMEVKDLEYQRDHFSKKLLEYEADLKNKKDKLKEFEKINKEKLEKMLQDFTEKKIIISDII